MFFRSQHYPITVGKARRLYPMMPAKMFDAYLEEYGIYRQPVNDLIDGAALHAAVCLFSIKQLWLDFGDQWYKHFSDDKPELHGLIKEWGSEEFADDCYFPLNPSSKILKELKAMQPTGTRIAEPLSDKKRTPRHELAEITKAMYADATVRIYCKDCRTKEYHTKGECRHSTDRKRYSARFYVPGQPDRAPVRKFLESRFVDDAIVELRNVYKALRESSYRTTELIEQQRDGAIVTLSDAIREFKAYKRNNDDRIIVRASNGAKYLDSIDKALDVLETQLANMGYSYFPLKMLGNNHVFRNLYDKLSTYTVTKEDKELNRVKASKQVGDRLWGDVTINGYTNVWSMMCKWLIEVKRIDVSNPFKSALIPVTYTPKAMDDEQFEELLEWLATRPKLSTSDSKRVSPADIDWIRRAFLIQARHDVRLDDLVNAKWTDIQFNERRGIYIFRTVNNKVTRKKKAGIVFRYAPVTKELVDAFGRENFLSKAGKLDDYILLDQQEQAGRVDRGGTRVRPIGRDRVKRKISQGFGELCRIRFGKEFDLTNKSLRKLKMTDNSATFEDAWKESHASKRVFDEHYVDPKLKAIKQADEKVFRI